MPKPSHRISGIIPSGKDGWEVHFAAMNRKQAGEDVDYISISAARALTDMGYAERTASGWIISPLGNSTLSTTDQALRRTPSAQGVTRLTRLSTIIGVTTIGIVISAPWSPIAGRLADVMTPVDFLSLTTPVLVFAGLGLGKDAPLMRRIGWRIIPVGLVSFATTFIASAAIAELALH